MFCYCLGVLWLFAGLNTLRYLWAILRTKLSFNETFYNRNHFRHNYTLLRRFYIFYWISKFVNDFCQTLYVPNCLLWNRVQPKRTRLLPTGTIRLPGETLIQIRQPAAKKIKVKKGKEKINKCNIFKVASCIDKMWSQFSM